MKDKILGKYIAKNHVGTVFTDNELQVIKQGDADQLVETFLDMNSDYHKSQMQCAIKSLNSFMFSNMELDEIEYSKDYKGQFVGCQLMDGDIDVFLGVAGDDNELLSLASAYSREELKEFDSDAYDALCELINIMNGAYATELGNKDIEVTLHPPVFYMDTQVKSDGGFYVVSFNMAGHFFKILMCANNRIQLIA